jgi:hypothetical protein
MRAARSKPDPDFELTSELIIKRNGSLAPTAFSRSADCIAIAFQPRLCISVSASRALESESRPTTRALNASSFRAAIQSTLCCLLIFDLSQPFLRGPLQRKRDAPLRAWSQPIVKNCPACEHRLKIQEHRSGQRWNVLCRRRRGHMTWCASHCLEFFRLSERSLTLNLKCHQCKPTWPHLTIDTSSL